MFSSKKIAFTILILLNLVVISIISYESFQEHQLLRSRGCPSGIYCFNDYFEGLAYAQKVDKPMLIMFTGYACVSSRKHEDVLFKNKKNSRLIKDNYILIILYVDDNRALPQNEMTKIEFNGRERIVKTIGDKWAYFEASDNEIQIKFKKGNSRRLVCHGTSQLRLCD